MGKPPQAKARCEGGKVKSPHREVPYETARNRAGGVTYERGPIARARQVVEKHLEGMEREGRA